MKRSEEGAVRDPEASRTQLSPSPPAAGPFSGWAFHPTDPTADAGSVFRNYPITTRIALSVTAAALVLLALMAIPATREGVQSMDDAVFRFMLRVRWTPAVWVGYLFNVLGGSVITVPLRLAMTIWLSVTRRWWFLATFFAAEVSSELLNTFLKQAYDRARPPQPLVDTSGASFPSGHAIAASVIALILVALFIPPGRQRRRWWIGAIVFTLLMAASRAYLRAHWLSDAVGGVLIGSSCALVSALLIQGIRDRLGRRAAERAIRPEEAEKMPEPGPLETTVRDEEPGGSS
jgi:undecaprenyl-diphosphatase